MITGAKIRNKDRLFSKLQRMAPEAAKALADESFKAAEEMVATAKSYVPVRHGNLRDSIVATPGGAVTPSYSQPGGSQVVPQGAALVTAGNNKVRYPHLVEYGTRPHENRGKFAGTTNPGAPAQPFFWPAFRLLRRRFRARMSRAMNAAIKKAIA